MSNKKNKKVNEDIKDNNKNVISDDHEPIKIPQFISVESSLGSVALLASKSQGHKFLFMSDLEWLIIPPISIKQFALFRSKKNEPIAFVSWAKVSDDVEKRLLSGSTKLQPGDWNSGNKLYIMDVISPFMPSKDILKEIQENQLKDQDINILRHNKETKAVESVLVSDLLKVELADQNSQDTKGSPVEGSA